MEKIILASGSPRRRELLSQIDIEYEVILSNVDEHTEETLPDKIVMDLSRQKALEVASRAAEGKIVLGADTVVAVDDTILGKPSSRDNAFEMIRSLSGRVHSVYTGVTLVKKCGKSNKIVSFSEKTDVYVKEMSDDEIWAYIDTGESKDKAGAYGIQGRFAAFVEKINGDYNNIVGLPISRVYDELKKFTCEV